MNTNIQNQIEINFDDKISLLNVFLHEAFVKIRLIYNGDV